jgi:hypothetical protein
MVDSSNNNGTAGPALSGAAAAAAKKRKNNTKITGGSQAAGFTSSDADGSPLPAGSINILRLVNANIAEPSSQRITGKEKLLV